MHFLFSPIHLLFLSYSLLVPFLSCPFFFFWFPIHYLKLSLYIFPFPLTWQIQQIPKGNVMFFSYQVSCLETIHFKPTINWVRRVVDRSPKQRLIKWYSTKFGAWMPVYSIPFCFCFIHSRSFPINFLFIVFITTIFLSVHFNSFHFQCYSKKIIQ